MLKATRFGIAAGLLSILLAAPAAFAAEQIIDDFSDALPAPGTLFEFMPLNVFNEVDMSTVTATDTGISGVVGGTRGLSVTITSCMLCELIDFTQVGVIPSGNVLDYSSSSGADAQFELAYDAGGAGLDLSLSFALGIRVPLIGIDPAVYPLTVTVTLTSGANTAMSTMTIPMGMTTLDLDFPFAMFTGISGIDLDALSSIRVLVDPSGGSAAGDLQVSPITTFGTPPTETQDTCQNGIDDDNDGTSDCDDLDCVPLVPECRALAPALSHEMLGVLLLVMAGAGFLGIVRLRRSAN